MKIKTLLSLFLLCFFVYAGFSQERQLYTRLTWNHIEQIQNNLPNININTLEFRLSESFILNVKPHNKDNANKIITNVVNGELQFFPVDPLNPTQKEKIVINNKEYKGVLHFISDSQKDKEILEIFFSKENSNEIITMKFKRDMRDLFTLVSVVINNELYIPNSSASLPHLIVPASGLDFRPTITVEPGHHGMSNKPLTAPSSPRAVSTYSSSVYGNEFIEGQGNLSYRNINAIVDFISQKNINVNRNFIFDLIRTYLEEAAMENINVDIAIAQMLHNTNFLMNQSRINAHNYAGFDVSSTPFTRYWNRGFNNMITGVRAHIQHLKGYASYSNPKTEIVNPRWDYISGLRGTVRTLDDLAQRWSPHNPDYANSIRRFLIELQRVQDKWT